jgi:hypothetical protein
MNQIFGSKLILVEGLTGSGKSTMAHFIARQLHGNGISARWVHEGEVPHPFLIDLETSVSEYMTETKSNWDAYIDQVASSDQVHIIEASFFNNLFESLLAHNVESAEIMQYMADLQSISHPLAPILVYLVQENLSQALARNFERRGRGFRDFVIELTTSTPLAQERGWQGYSGMLQFWQAFVAFTDVLFAHFPGQKLMIDNTAGDWADYNQQVVDFLGISLIPDQQIPRPEAQGLIGLYIDRQNERAIRVRYADGELSINLFLQVWTDLVRRAPNVYEAAGWPFEIRFESADLKSGCVMKIGGRDVDYLPLVGTVAVKASA